MKRLVFACVALLPIGCSDQTPAARAPTAPLAPSFSRAAAPAPRGLSTVCLSYTTQLANAHEKLEKFQKGERADEALEAKLTKKVESFDKLVADACR